jgi:hypothetical protein
MNTHLSNDPCYLNADCQINNKKLKYITTNLGNSLKESSFSFFNISNKDGYTVPSKNINQASQLRNGINGNQLTNCNIKTQIGQLPLNYPSKYKTAHGNLDEKNPFIKVPLQLNKKSYTPKDNNFYNRSFQIFSSSTPQLPINSFIQENRVGLSTRFM